MGIIEEKWNALFETYGIAEQVKRQGIFSITADQIREFKEPRLMTKFDTRESVLTVFGKLGILPVTRGSYVIGDFSLYHDFPEEESRGGVIQVDRSRIPDYLETIDVRDVRSEAAAIKLISLTGILEDFLGEKRLVETVSGRMSSGAFDFQIHSGDRKHVSRIQVNNSQLEIDGGFEGRDSFAILEGKNVVHSNFLVRQLYYPFRLWEGRLTKPVRPVFLVCSNQIFRLLEYEFDDPMVYDSIRLVKEQRYSLEDTRITMEDLAGIMGSVSVKPEPEGVPFIQADSFEKVISLIEHLGEKPLTMAEIAEIFGFQERQSGYYYNACAYLGLAVRKKGRDGVVRAELTERGVSISRMDYKKRQLAYAGRILEHEIFHQLFETAVRTGKLPDKPYIQRKMKELRLCGDSLIGRRASSVAGWLRWMVRLTEE